MSFNWKTTKLGEVCDIRRGSSPRPIQNFLSNTGMPWVKIADATAESTRYIQHTNEFIKMEGVQKSVIVTPGTLIVSNSGTAGLPKFMAITACVHDGWLVLTRLRGILPDFLYYTILVSRRGLLHNAYDSVMKNLTIDMIRDLEVSLPTLVEQENITKILKVLDDKIELNIAINKNLEEMAQALFKRWFVDFEFPNENGEPYKSCGGEFEESELGLIPKDWRVLSLDEIIEINPKISLIKGSTHPYVEMKNLTNNYGRVTEYVIREFSAGSKFINGDVLLARITPCLENGKTAYVDFLDKDQVGWGSTEFIVLRSCEKLPREFTYFLVRSDLFRTHAISNMTGSSGRQRVPDSSLKNYKISIPDNYDIISAFGEIARNAIGLMKKNDEESKRLINIRDTLLPKLMSGDIRVPVEQEYTQAFDLPMVAESSEKYIAH